MFITAICVIFLIKLRWPKSKSLYDTVFGVSCWKWEWDFDIAICELSPIFDLSRNLYELWTLRIYSNLYVISSFTILI